MPTPIPLQHGKYYHVYNRGNNRENVFIKERNYHYFLELYVKYVVPIANTFAYCLLRNHFHFLLQIKDLSGLRRPDRSKKPSQYFSNLFNAYTKAINKTYNRTGSLFQRPFGRIEVTSDDYFAGLVIYIHQNSQKHGFVDDFRTWPYSSYRAILSTKPTHVQRDDVLEWFDNANNFVASHRQEVAESQIAPLVLDDFD